MKKIGRTGAALLMMLFVCLTAMRAQSYESLWRQVEQAQQKSLPKSVVKITGDICRKAERERNVPQLFKAYITANAYRQRITPDSAYVAVKHLENWAHGERDTLNKAMLHSLLASDYAALLSANRRGAGQFTALDLDEVPADMREWSANLYIYKVDEHVRAALKDAPALLRASSIAYRPFVETGEESRFFGHDLYHLLAMRAADTYSYLALCPDTLRLSRVAQLHADMACAYQDRKGMEDAAVLASLWHANSLRRYKSVLGVEPYRKIVEEYLFSLDKITSRYGDRSQMCSVVCEAKANTLADMCEDRKAEALQVCEEAIRRYPKGRALNDLKNLRARLLWPSLQVRMAKTASPNDSLQLFTNCVNLKGFTLNLYSTRLADYPERTDDKSIAAYRAAGRKVASHHFDLSSRSSVLKIPTPGKPGVYVVQVVPDAPSARSSENLLALTRFKVLSLPLPDEKMELAVLDAVSGQPVRNAMLNFYARYDERSKTRRKLLSATTDVSGKAIIVWNKDIRSCIAHKGEDCYMPHNDIYQNRFYVRREAAEESKLTLLTDRVLYRPGQTVYVKGIAYGQTDDAARVLPGKAYTLCLLDVNGKQVASQQVLTNDFGSFTAEFVLPASCLNGNFSVEAGVEGRTQIRVEEYKRPTFELTFNSVKEAYVLGDTVTLTGMVKAFNGVSLQNLPLAYTVTRENHFLRYGYVPGHSANAQIVADSVRLDSQGCFSIRLPLSAPAATGGNKVVPHVKDAYNFVVEAVVTGDAGETQSGKFVIRAGRQAYSFNSDVMNGVLCKEKELSSVFTVCNASGEQLAMNVTCRLYPFVDGKSAKVSGRPAYEASFPSGKRQDLSAWKGLPPGRYRMVLSVIGRNGMEVSDAEMNNTVSLISSNDTRIPFFSECFSYNGNTEFDAGHPAVFSIGTSFKDTYMMMDVFSEVDRVESRTFVLSDSIARFEYPYKEEYGKGLSVVFTFVRNGHMQTQYIELKKRRSERVLGMKWEVFRDRLRPGDEEEWKLLIKEPDGKPASAELLALMYDASLDKLLPVRRSLELSFSDNLPYRSWERSYEGNNYYSPHFPLKYLKLLPWLFDRFFSPYGRVENVSDLMGYHVPQKSARADRVLMGKKERASGAVGNGYAPGVVEEDVPESGVVFESEVVTSAADGAVIAGAHLQPLADLRTNFAETAFFYPQLRTNEQGEVAFSFTMPQSLTRWNFNAYAHTKEMMTGNLYATVVTAKEFMLTPNMPRFVRVGDDTRIAASIANLTEKKVKGTATLTLFEPATEKVVYTQRRKFSAEAGENCAVTFGFEVSDRYELLGVRIVADGGTFSDGEQHLLPVLSNKERIVETLPMYIRGKETRVFRLDSLFNGNSPTATGRRLTLEFTGNPAWYAVQALPALSQSSSNNAIAQASALYANTLATYIANGNPRIKAVFERLDNSKGDKEGFIGKLENNLELKNMLLAESPWLLEAETDAEQSRRIAILFDINQMEYRNDVIIRKLQELQQDDGSWGWYAGMACSPDVTRYVAKLLSRLPWLTGKPLPAEALAMRGKAFEYLNRQALESYRSMLKEEKKGVKITSLPQDMVEYVYLVTLASEKLSGETARAFNYFLTKAAGNITDTSISTKAHVAVALLGAGRKAEATKFVASIKEHLVQSDELGAHFAFNEGIYSWGMMPVSVHVDAMEALRSSGDNDALLEEMKLWLLKRKQTTVWNSPVATADAVYALLMTGGNLLSGSGDVYMIKLGDTDLHIRNSDDADFLVESSDGLAEMGYVKRTFAQGDAELKAESVTIDKRDDGMAWGAVYAQYLSPISDVKQRGGELNVEKKLFVERIASDGRKSLRSVSASMRLKPGDKIVSRLTIRLDRAMDFVHLKDSRGACFEPVGSLSGYRHNGSCSYYVEVEDASANFFFDHLDKGVYVLEHGYRIARGGTYETGIATLQCAYAPEYASHSAGGTITVD